MSFFLLAWISGLLWSISVVAIGLYEKLPLPIVLRNVLDYLTMAVLGFAHMAVSSESSYKRPKTPAASEITSDDEKIIVFVRHGESVWNEVFNRGFGLSFIVRLATALFRELHLIARKDSVFFDTPLGHDGLVQASDFETFLHSDDQTISETARKIVSILSGTSSSDEKVVFCCSNLRRAIETAGIALDRRIEKTGERIEILSCLQEMSRNVDTQSVLVAQESPLYGFSRKSLENKKSVMWGASNNFGNKGLFSDGLTRQKEFLNWTFERKENIIVVAGGHSLYFREFFRNFLPRAADHIAKKKKIVNCGCIAFRILKSEQPYADDIFVIPPESLEVVYGGFSR